VATEGGPGYATTGSADDYVALFGPLLRSRSLLLVDDRGTGDSAAIDCPGLQRYRGRTDGEPFAARVAGCARAIDRHYAGRVSPGTHPANLFATAYAADDLAAVTRALRTGRIDLYGDSYGTWLAQSVAARHPSILDAVVLDSAYPVRGLDPLYRSSVRAARSALDGVCSRDLGCRSATAAGRSTPTGRLARLAARLRAGPPVRGTVPGSGGHAERVVVGVRTLADLVQDAASDVTVDRELDAAVRAALDGDPVPLVRLVVKSDAAGRGTGDAHDFSDGLYFAVACTDYPQLYPMAASPVTRGRSLADRLDREVLSDAFTPFRATEWLSISAYSETFRACLHWPAVMRVPRAQPASAGPLPARVPVLVVGGDLDSLTPLHDVPKVATRLGRGVRIVPLANTVHIVSEGNDALSDGARCGQGIIRAFFAEPGRLRSLDTTCAGRIPPVHTPGAFPRRLADAAAARLVAGPDPGITARRAVTVAVQTLGDAVACRVGDAQEAGRGLRGGRFTAHGGRIARIRLAATRFVDDAAVHGLARVRIRGGIVDARLAVHLPDGGVTRVAVHWSAASREASATLGDTRLRLPAP
jgi:pimeloyl-ACP methyl ester carboxylesterase